MRIKSNSRVGFFAKTDYGKTYFANEFAKVLLKTGCKVYLYNTNYEENMEATEITEPTGTDNTDITQLNAWIIEKRSNAPANSFLWIEDLDGFFQSSTIGAKTAEIKRLFDNGRHQNVGVLYSAKNLRYIPLKLISNTDLLYVGQFAEQADLERIASIGIPKRAVLSLHDHIFIKFDKLTNDLNARMEYTRV